MIPDLDSALEHKSRAEVESWQLERLREQTRWVRTRSRFWGDALAAAGMSEESLVSVRDFLRVPYLTKQQYQSELRANPPYGGFLCITEEERRDEGAHIFRTTGTTGRPTSIIKSQLEARAFAVAGARNMKIAGVRPGDYVFMTFPFSQWTAAWGFYLGAPQVGAIIIPAGAPLDTGARSTLMEDFRPRVMVCTPSYALAFAEALQASGADPTRMGVELILVGGEPISGARRRQIEAAWAAPGGVRNFSGISEVAAVYLGVECEAQEGMHLYEDLARYDILNPQTAEPADARDGGELVVTSLVPTALSLNYHFRTGDFAHFTDAPCGCGRTTRRLLNIETRLDDMRKIRGINVWASAVEELLGQVAGLGGDFELLLDRRGELDEVTVRVEADSAIATGEYRALALKAESHLRAILGLRLPVEVVAPGVVPRYELKAKRWVDRRK